MDIGIVTSIFPPDVGGPATSVPLLAAGLVERGHRVRVVTLADRDGAELVAYPFEVQRVRRDGPWSARWARTVAAVTALGRASDILLANGLHVQSAVAASLSGRQFVAKVVGDWVWERARSRGWVTDDLLAFQHHRPSPRERAMRGARRWSLGRAATVVVPCAFLARIVAGWRVGRNPVVVPNAVAVPSDLVPVPRSDGRLMVVTACRLTAWKGVDGLIAAAASIEGANLTVVGEGPERTRLQAQAAQLGLRVRFTGGRSRLDTLSLIASADAFVLNSTYEGLPHVVLEAMALGRAVVATTAGGVPEVVHDGHNGLLVPPGDTVALRAALERLGDATLRQRLGRAAAAVTERFAPKRTMEAMEALLLRVVGR